MKRGTSSGPRKVQYGSVPLFIACCFTLAFTLGYITFYNFLKHYSALMEKKIFVTKFSFLTDLHKPLTLLTAIIHKVYEIFLSALPKL